MTVSALSVIMSVVCSSVILVSAGFLVSHAKKIRWGLVLLIILLGFIRLSLPIDFMYAKVIRSWYLYPYVQQLVSKKRLFGLTLGQILGIIWISGSTYMFYGFFKRIRDLGWIVAHSVPVIDGDHLHAIYQKAVDEIGYHGKARIAVTKNFSTAVSAGIRSPKILIPKGMLDYPEEELLGVIKHELTHYLRRDVGKQWALYATQCIFWWNPAVHYLKRCVVEMLELECDEHVCRGMDEEERLAYLEAMEKVLKSMPKKELELGMGYVKNHSVKFMERRFREVLEPVQRYSMKVTLCWAIVCIILFFASYAFILQPVVLPKDMEQLDEEMFIAPTGASEFLLRVSDDTYYYVSDLTGRTYLTSEDIKKAPYVGLPIYDISKGE